MILIVVGCCTVLVLILVLLIVSFPRKPDNVRHEKSFLNDSSLLPFLLKDESTVDLSVIIPAYNEEDRLPAMLTDCLGLNLNLQN